MFKKIFSSFLCFTVIFVSCITAFSADSANTAAAAKVYETPYYYSMLTDNGKLMYKDLKRAILNCDKKVKIKYSIDQKDFEQIAELLIFHDPMTFNLENIEVSSGTNSITFKLSYRYDKETYDKMTVDYQKEAAEILGKLTEDMSVYKKIRTIHDSIINSTVYDLNSSTGDTVYGTLVKNKAKCDGYAKAFSYICGQAGIRAVTVIGDDKKDTSDSMHMWNKVYYNKKWYNVDVTWDDPVSNLKDNLQYDFFMVSDSALKNTHSENNFSFDAPPAVDDSKDYFTVNKKYAESLDSAKDILKKGLVSAAEKNKNCVTFKCSSKSVYEEVKNYVNDPDAISKAIENVNKKARSSLIPKIYSNKFNDDQYIINIYIFYENSDLDDYFTSLDELDSSALKLLEKYGIK